MMWLIFGLLVIGVGMFYAGGFILRVQDSAYLAAKMPSWFPLLHYKFPQKHDQIVQLGAWAILLPILGYYILRHNQWALAALMAFAVWEVYLGATFYLNIGNVAGARDHMILHGVIAGMIASYFLRGYW